MDVRASVILSAAILVGFVLHGLLQPTVGRVADATPPGASDAAHRQRLAEIEAASDVELDRALLERGAPRVLKIQAEELLYDPDWKRTSGGFTLTSRYYRLVEGRLVPVPMAAGSEGAR